MKYIKEHSEFLCHLRLKTTSLIIIIIGTWFITFLWKSTLKALDSGLKIYCPYWQARVHLVPPSHYPCPSIAGSPRSCANLELAQLRTFGLIIFYIILDKLNDFLFLCKLGVGVRFTCLFNLSKKSVPIKELP